MPDQERRLRYREFRGAELATGETAGVLFHAGALRLGNPAGIIDYTDPHTGGSPMRYEWGSWISPPVLPGFPVAELVASWQARTPGGSWLELAVAVSSGPDGGRAGEDRPARWYPLARWADHDERIRPASVPAGDQTGRTSTDAFVASRTDLVGYRLRGILYRPEGSSDCPTLSSVGAIASAGAVDPTTAGRPGPLVAAGGRILDVPISSQRAYSGQYPHWDGGGDAWCSPTSTSMVLRYWGVGPARAEYGWVRPDYADGFIHHAVRHCYDYSFQGAGNWAFNTAYTARYGMSAFVTRLRDLTEAERFIAAGIPLVASIRFAPGELTGAGYTTNGHLLVIVGFTAAGHVVVNDPGARDRDTVRRTYDRHEFAASWLAGSGGAVYVIHPPDVPLPPPPAEPNW
jgi:hypothetical protein